VAIVGDVGASLDTYKLDMDRAVNALQNGGVDVTKFYYGERTFGWSDIVTAAQGAHFLLYMGHGVYWGNTEPLSVGGFYLGPGQYVSPTDIREDLGGRLDPDSLVILSHACFSAGNSSTDPGPISQGEAARRVGMYASPFVDIGVKAYFANNYFSSAARTVNQILQNEPAGSAFENSVGYDPAKRIDLSYDEPGYDLWLNGSTGDWHLGFVGQPYYVFDPSDPILGPLPDELAFLYSIPDGRTVPITHTLQPANVGDTQPLSWSIAISATWLSVSPLAGVTPQEIVLSPTNLASTTVGTRTGTMTIEVTTPTDTTGSPARIALSLSVLDEPIHDQYLPLASQNAQP
jgi:hypothetical protein